MGDVAVTGTELLPEADVDVDGPRAWAAEGHVELDAGAVLPGTRLRGAAPDQSREARLVRARGREAFDDPAPEGGVMGSATGLVGVKAQVCGAAAGCPL